MSNEGPQVSIGKDSGYKTQWAKGLFYRKEGGKFVFKKEKIKYGIYALFLITTLVVLFQDPPNLNEQEQLGVNPPDRIDMHQPQIELSAYEDTKEVKKRKKKKILKIEPLSIVSRKDKVKIPLGTSAKAVLKTGGTNGPIKAVLLEDVEFNGETYIPSGSTLWGVGNSTEERLLITFTKFVSADGKAKDITATAYDNSDQILGLKGSIIGRTSKKLLAGVGLGVAGALQTMQQSENMGGVAVVKPTLGNAALNGASTAALGIAEQELEELKNKQTVVEVPKNTEIVVVFGEL